MLASTHPSCTTSLGGGEHLGLEPGVLGHRLDDQIRVVRAARRPTPRRSPGPARRGPTPRRASRARPPAEAPWRSAPERRPPSAPSRSTTTTRDPAAANDLGDTGAHASTADHPAPRTGGAAAELMPGLPSSPGSASSAPPCPGSRRASPGRGRRRRDAPPGGVGDQLGEPQGERRGPCHPVEQRVRPLDQLVRRYDVRDQAAAASASPGVEPPPGQQHLLGHRLADQLPQPPAGAGRGEDAQSRLGVAEDRRPARRSGGRRRTPARPRRPAPSRRTAATVGSGSRAHPVEQAAVDALQRLLPAALPQLADVGAGRRSRRRAPVSSSSRGRASKPRRRSCSSRDHRPR